VTSPASDLFDRLRAGDSSVLDELISALYDELHRLAARHLRGERPQHTLQTTALVNEVYLKLVRGERQFADRAHFLAVASRVMRQVLVDYARARSSQKRDSGFTLSLDVAHVQGGGDTRLVKFLDLDAALHALAAEHEHLSRLVELLYFGGMNAEETAVALGIPVHTVRYDLRLAHAWLRRRLSDYGRGASPP
jgi:RNA polymerase sigma factor (TIGR02999 family)